MDYIVAIIIFGMILAFFLIRDQKQKESVVKKYPNHKRDGR